ncbi:MAG: HlyD family efflux transporter periplasmic adaptor subunit [Chloroflexota bacterium]
MKKKTIFLLLFMIFAVACIQAGPPDGAEDATLDVDALEGGEEETSPLNETLDDTPTPAPIETGVTIVADGHIVAPNPLLSLAFTTNGRLLTLNVNAGDAVSAGDVIATLEDTALQEAVENARLQVAQSENSLAQSQLSLDDLLTWEPDETAVVLAEANVAAAEASLDQTQEQAGVSQANLTSANVQINQARRGVEDAQKAYDTAHDPGRDWELGDPFRKDFLESEREATARALIEAREALDVAFAQYNISASNIDNETALSNAQVSLITAQQSLESATKGPTESEISAAELQVEQAQLALEQSQLALMQAENALEDAQLTAPISGIVETVDVVNGTLVSAGTLIVTILDTNALEFHTTNVSERDLGQLSEGDTAVITLKTYPNDSITAEILRIGQQSTGTVGDAAVFPVILSFEDDDFDIRPGMTGRVEIRGE